MCFFVFNVADFVGQIAFDDSKSDETPCLVGEPYPCIQCISITVQDFAQLLQELDPSKACGPDGIPTKLLKETSYVTEFRKITLMGAFCTLNI